MPKKMAITTTVNNPKTSFTCSTHTRDIGKKRRGKLICLIIPKEAEIEVTEPPNEMLKARWGMSPHNMKTGYKGPPFLKITPIINQ
jgi:hypothetical protein